MRRVLFVCSFLFAVAMMTGSALAGPGTDGDKCVKDKAGIVRCSFGGSEIPGVLQRPEGGIISGDIVRDWGSLIDYRTDFTDEFVKTVEEL